MLYPTTLSTFILLFITTRLASTLPPSRITPDRQAHLANLAAQKPLHTTALLAGAAAAPSHPPEPRIRDLQSVTGEKGMWVNLDDLRREAADEGDVEEEEEVDYEVYKERTLVERVRGKIRQVRAREGWRRGQTDALEI